jgi:hypothetical protein
MPEGHFPALELMGLPTTWIRRVRCYALLAVLLTFTGAHDASAQRLLCSTIRPGETAGLVARRITGDAGNTRQAWFQILNPATTRFVAKSGYNHIRAGWQACIVNESAVAGSGTKTATAPRRARGLDSIALWGLLVVLIALVTYGATEYLDNRKAAVGAMRRFGERFVQEFERPLIRPGPGDRPIQSRLRFIPHRARLDVLLAPNAGRRYPNLADHKKNVEYDVVRVVELLRTYPFVAGRVYARGRWVVVPFQLTTEHRQAGVQ